MANLDHMYRKRHPNTSFWRSLPASAGGIGYPLASSAIGPYSYERGLVDGGFITAADMRYHFFVTDHLGNVRVVVNDAGVVEQVNHFYPYGEATDMGQALPASVENPYKWSGKEWDADQGAYDFGARMYSPSAMRWMTMDPLCEKFYDTSPYAYCAGNPVNLVDPDGRDWYHYFDENGDEQMMWIFGCNDPTYEDENGTVWERSSRNKLTLTINDQDVTFSQSEDGTLDISSLVDAFSVGSFAVGGVGDVAEAGEATFRMTNGKGQFDFHIYSSGWSKGNQYIKPSQITKVSALGKAINGVGYGLGFLGVLSSGFQFLQAKTEDEKVENGVDAAVGLFGLIPGVGTGISLYWTIGGKKVYWEYTVPRALAGEDVVTPF